jgi:hypothetical protein
VIMGHWNAIMEPLNVNRGPWIVVMEQCNVIIGLWNVNRGQCNMNMEPVMWLWDSGI